LSRCGSSGNAVSQTAEVQRDFSTQGVLIAFHCLDFVHGQIELKSQAVNGLTGGPHQLELGVAEPARPEAELGIKIIAINLSDAAKTVASIDDVPISPVVQRGSGARQIPESQRLIGFVLEAHNDVDDFVPALCAGAKVGNSRGKVICVVAECLVTAERVLGGAGGGRGNLSLGGGRRKRTECQQERRNTQNPKDRWN
jgi:hypothetical protein